MKRKILIFTMCLLLLFYFYSSGYRFTPKQAADSHVFLEKGAQIISEVDVGWGHAYIYKVADYHLTVLAIKHGFLWRAPVSCHTKEINDKNDRIRTIGWMSYTNNEKEKATILVIENKDDNVAYIEAGKESERNKKDIRKGELVTFVWDDAFFPHDVEPIALSRDNRNLYRYGYPLGTTYLRDQDMKWHSVN